MKKYFVCRDYSFCSCGECEKKENCIRWIGHYPELKNECLSYILIEDWKKCVTFKCNGGDK